MRKPLVVVKPGDRIQLKKIDSAIVGRYTTKEGALKRLEKLSRDLETFQEVLYAEGKRSLLIILQAMDTGGKDGAVRHLFTGVNPAGVQVSSFKKPSVEELSHDFLWRVHKVTPPRGIIGVWNRSHYEDVLIVRVHKMITRETCLQRYEDINEFEETLADNGVTILKFFLHISKDEQKRRLQARLDDPSKHWKFDISDVDERKLWDGYQKAYEDAINACSTEKAPWYVVPSDHKWQRNLLLMETVVETLRAMNPQYPEKNIDVKAIRID